jgi:secondary thiamine-phosphate synthase enzyme
MENADPTAQKDLEKFFARLVPEGLPYFEHTSEGDDDMPSHIKMVLTKSEMSLPVTNGELELGAWQGVYLWEHRRRGHSRQLVVSVF